MNRDETGPRAGGLTLLFAVAALTITAAGCVPLAQQAPARKGTPATELVPPYNAAALTKQFVCKGSDGFANSGPRVRTFLWRPEWLMAIKAARDTPAFAPTREALLSEANKALAQGPFSVVDKTHVPPSGDKHDYYSVAPYSWPNPDTPNGLPYIDRDGQVNPERYDRAFDTGALEKMSRGVASLALAYHLTDDRRYAEHAGKLLRVWFVAPATRMNPNLKFAQAVPGRVDGRAAGLIDTYRLVRVVEAIGLIGRAGVLSKDEQSSLEAWFGAYADWLRSDPLGVTESQSTNNHGIYHDAQVMSFSLFARRDKVAREVADAFVTRRIAAQVEPDGSLPRELRRTRTFHYSNYAVAGAFDVASFAECFGMDVWNARAPNGGSLRGAFDFIAAYAGRENQWPYPELHLDTEPLYDLLVRASWAYGSADYGAAAARYTDKHRGSLSPYLRVAPIGEEKEKKP